MCRNKSIIMVSKHFIHFSIFNAIVIRLLSILVYRHLSILSIDFLENCVNILYFFRRVSIMNDVERVKLLCKKNGITISELEKTLSFSNGSLGKVKNELSRERVTKIANYFNVSKEVITGEDAIDNRIKVYGSVPAGIPLEAIEDVVDWEDIPKEWLIGGQEYIGLKVKGDSMYPKYLDGDTVIVRLQPDCECGQEAVVYTNGYDATLKKVVKQQDGIMLQPLNPEYVPSVYPYGDDNQVKILGVVVEIRRKV